MKIFRNIVAVLLMLLFVGCNDSSDSTSNETVSKLASGVDREYMDTSVRSQDDFYNYVNGIWMKNKEIPSDASYYDIWSDMQKVVDASLQEIIQDASKNTEAQKGSNEQILGDFYNSYIDVDTINSKGISPLQSDLDAILEASTYDDIARLMADLKIKGSSIPFNYRSYKDRKDTTRYLTYIWQSGLGLGDKEYYFSQEEKYTTIRDAYKTYISSLMSLAGYEDAELMASHIMALETQLAEVQWSDEANDISEDTYNKYTLDDAKTLLGSFDIETFLSVSGLDISEMIIKQPSYFQEFGKVFETTSVSVWQEYLAYQHIRHYTRYLSDDFVEIGFDFFHKTLAGEEKQTPREEQAFILTNTHDLGEILSELYVGRYKLADTNTKVQEIAHNTLESFKRAIDESQWVKDTTKELMKAEIDKVSVEIITFDSEKDYSAIEMKADDLVGNIMRYNIYASEKAREKLEKVVDNSSSSVTAQELYFDYDNDSDTIIFTPAVLLTPLFQLDADDAVNYASVGTIVSGLISEKFIKTENNIWDASDFETLGVIGEKLTKQYGAYNVFEDENITFGSVYTLQTVIAELGGVEVAYRAYKESLSEKTSSVIDGFTGEQRFFIGFTQAWRDKINSEELLKNKYIPGNYMANGVLANMSEFYEAFDIKEGDEMYKIQEERVKIW